MAKYSRYSRSSSSKGIIWVDDDPSTHSIAADQEASYAIGDLSSEYKVTLRALRFYENKGLLAPRREGTNRLYSERDRARLGMILQGKRLGFTLGEISAMIATSEKRPDAPPLALTREKCLEQITLLERQRREIDAALAELRRIYTSFYAASEDDLPPA